jgi:hypothetical protein
MAFCLVFAAIVGIATLLAGSAPRPAVRARQEQKMPDGTILVLEKVTVGSHHQFEWERKQSFGEWISGNWASRQTASAWMPGEGVVVWFSRRDPVTDTCLDVDWWLRSAAVDEFGDEIEDDNAGRNILSAHGSSGLSGSRPFSPEAPGRDTTMVVAHSGVRQFRHSGKSFEFRVYNVKDELVATFDIPHAPTTALPEWKPEPLPATKKADDLEVTVTRVLVHRHETTTNGRRMLRSNFWPELRIMRDGQSAPDWVAQQTEFEDVFGNRSSQWDGRLSTHESAWKLKIVLWPTDKAPSDPAREWNVPALPLAAAGKADLVRQKNDVDGLGIEFIAVGGRGKVVYTDSAPAGSGNGSSSSGGSFGNAPYNVETRSAGGTATTTIDCNRPHLLLRTTAVADRRLVVRVRDDQERNVPVHECYVSDQLIIFLEPPADAKTLGVTFVVQQPKRVEFFVKPPGDAPDSSKGQGGTP